MKLTVLIYIVIVINGWRQKERKEEKGPKFTRFSTCSARTKANNNGNEWTKWRTTKTTTNTGKCELYVSDIYATTTLTTKHSLWTTILWLSTCSSHISDASDISDATYLNFTLSLTATEFSEYTNIRRYYKVV